MKPNQICGTILFFLLIGLCLVRGGTTVVNVNNKPVMWFPYPFDHDVLIVIPTGAD